MCITSIHTVHVGTHVNYCIHFLTLADGYSSNYVLVYSYFKTLDISKGSQAFHKVYK